MWRHESAKTWQVLVSLTACMVTSILTRPDELNMKSPVGVSGCRAWFFLGERYRLSVLLRLHAISLVGQPSLRSAVFTSYGSPFQGKPYCLLLIAARAVLSFFGRKEFTRYCSRVRPMTGQAVAALYPKFMPRHCCCP